MVQSSRRAAKKAAKSASEMRTRPLRRCAIRSFCIDPASDATG